MAAARGDICVVALMLALGLMAKSMLVTVPPLLLLLDYWPLGRFGQAADLPPTAADIARPGFWALAIEKLPLLAIAMADCGMTLATHFEHEKSLVLPWFARICNAVLALVTYLVQFFYPTDLAAFYPVPAAGYPAWKAAGAAAVLAALTAAAVLGRRRCPFLLVGWFWFLGMMTPVLGLVHISDHTMADRYTYLPSIGLAIAVSWSASRLAARLHVGRLLVATSAVVVIAILVSLATRQTAYWHDGLSLWTHSLASTQENTKAEGNLAFALAAANRLDEAIEHYHRALRPPIDPGVCNNLGIALAQQGKLDEAALQFRRAIDLDPRYGEAHANLGGVLVLEGHPREAMGELHLAIELKPSLPMPHFQLANLLLKEGKLDEAAPHFQRVLELEPNSVAPHLGLAAIYTDRGQADRAIAEYRAALQIAARRQRGPVRAAAIARCPAAGAVALIRRRWRDRLNRRPEAASIEFSDESLGQFP